MSETSTARITPARRITWAWLALVLITLTSWWLAPAHAGDAVQPSVPITAMVLVLAFVKSRVIITSFMEVRTAPRWLRWATDAWLVAVTVAVFAIYLW